MFVTHKRVLPSWVMYNVRVCFRRQNWKRVMTMVMVINRTTPGWPGGAVLSLQMTSSSSFPHRYDHSPTSSPQGRRKWGKAPVVEVVHSPKKRLLPQTPLGYFFTVLPRRFFLFVLEFLRFVINHFKPEPTMINLIVVIWTRKPYMNTIVTGDFEFLLTLPNIISNVDYHYSPLSFTLFYSFRGTVSITLQCIQ